VTGSGSSKGEIWEAVVRESVVADGCKETRACEIKRRESTGERKMGGSKGLCSGRGERWIEDLEL